jgi:hypothetical protein
MSVVDDIAKIKAALATSEARLKVGAARRKQMAKELAEGVINKTPRYNFLLTSSQAILDVLIEEAAKFNDNNIDDMISLEDMIDAVHNVYRNLEKKRAKEQPLPTGDGN